MSTTEATEATTWSDTPHAAETSGKAPKEKRRYRMRFVVVVAVGAFLVGGLSASGNTVTKEVPGPERVVTKEVPVEKVVTKNVPVKVTPSECVTALTSADLAFAQAADVLGVISDAGSVPTAADVTKLESVGSTLKTRLDSYRAARDDCRASSGARA